MMVKISVIMPVYNVALYLQKSIESVLRQSLSDLELICINDGSTDKSVEILAEYEIKDKRIKVINQINSGAGFSRNVGIEHAHGEYLFFMDADDWIDEKFLEEAYKTAKFFNADIVETTKSYNCYSNSKIVLFNKRRAIGFKANGVFFRRDVVWDKLFKREFVNIHNIKFSNGLCHNDAFFGLQSLYYKAFVVQNNTAIYWHNKANEASIRYKPSDKKLLSQLDMFILEIEFMNLHFFNYYDYRHNYRKLWHTAKRKRKYIKDAKNKQKYDEKLNQIKEMNKYPFSNIQVFFKKIFCSRFREEMKNSSANPKDYPRILKKWYQKKLGKPLNLKDPQTFNEKIQWLKLYDSTAEKTHLADKYLAREYIKQMVGEEYLVPLLGVYSKFDNIDFTELPNSFVLKCNHGSSMNAVITDKTSIDKKKLKKKFDNWMRENFGLVKGLQLHYNNIQHKIIAEEYIGSDEEYPDDIKIFCFSGKPYMIEYETNRKRQVCADFFDINWKQLEFKYHLPNSNKKIAKPNNLDKMLEIAQVLSKGFNFVRVDLYSKKGKIYVGELTFTPGNGISKFPNDLDIKLGKLLKIEKNKE